MFCSVLLTILGKVLGPGVFIAICVRLSLIPLTKLLSDIYSIADSLMTVLQCSFGVWDTGTDFLGERMSLIGGKVAVDL